MVMFHRSGDKQMKRNWFVWSLAKFQLSIY